MLLARHSFLYLMKLSLPIALLFTAFAAHAADPETVWAEALQAKGGRERLDSVRSLAIYMKPAQVTLTGPPSTWLCVFPDRYFEYDGRGSGEYSYESKLGPAMAGNPRAIVVNQSAGRVSMDANGTPRVTWPLTRKELDRLTVNQVVYLLESASLEPHPVSVKGRNLTVEASGCTFQITLDPAALPTRIVVMHSQDRKQKKMYDFQLTRYHEFKGIQLPARVTWIGGMTEWTWDVDYEVDADFNPKFFERMPDLANGPEPWRQP